MLFGQKKVDIIVIDQTNDDPFTRVSGDINGKTIQWIRANSHRVLAKRTADGVVTYCRLDDSDSTKYYDGTTAALDGSDGDVFMKMPEFYYKGTEGDIVRLYFAKEKLSDEYVRWDPNILIGVYEAYNDSSNMYSRSGVKSTGSVSQETCKTYAAERGTGYQLVDWQMHCVMGCLYYAQYGNTNCQNSIGKGTDAYNKSTGQTNSLGMTDTVAGGNGDSQSINFWGLENWWGNKYEWIHDYLNPADSLAATVDDPVNGGTRALPVLSYGGWYPEKMKFGRYLDLIATTDDPKPESDTVGYCDYQWWPGSTNSKPRVALRSYNNSNTRGGVACASANYTASYTGSSFGSRLAFRGSLIEEADVEAYKATEILSVYGVFIEATDGTLHQSTEWTGEKTANSIVVKQPTVAFRIALTQSSSTMRIHASVTGALGNYMTEIRDEAQAKLDMKSPENTANIMKLQSGTGYAAGYCNSFIFPDGKTKGLLPALGWLQTAYDNKSAVDACLAACGATAMDTSNDHWASTFWGAYLGFSSRCWKLVWSDGSVSYSGLTEIYRVRPFAAYGAEI